MRNVVAIAKAWHLPGLALAEAAAVMALHAVPHHAVAVPGRGGVASMLWPLCPVIAAAAVPRSASVLCGERELLGVRPRIVVRLAMATVVAMSSAPLLLTPFPTEVLLRNALFLTGLALLSSVLLPGPVAWLPTVALPTAMWLLGTTRAGARAWAMLLQPAGSLPAVAVAGLVLAAGLAAYGVVRGPVPRR